VKVFIRDLVQKEPLHLEIVWSDGEKTRWHLGLLQSLCPCARCSQRPYREVKEVFCQEVHPIGNYALHLVFSEGCSKGIYSYTLLRKLL